MPLNVVPGIVLATLDHLYTPMLCGFRTAVAGDVAVKNQAGAPMVIAGLAAGETFKGLIQQILTSGTTVASPTTNIVVFLSAVFPE